jgi:hypothetical protein
LCAGNGFTDAMPFFPGHPVPADVAIRGERASLIRPRVGSADWLGGPLLPAW